MKISEKQHITKSGQVKHNPKQLDAEDKYFRDYFEESDKVNGYDEFVEKGDNFYEYTYTKKDIVKILQSFDPQTKKQIRNTMVKIDFQNGNMQHFINYVMKGYTAHQRGEKI